MHMPGGADGWRHFQQIDQGLLDDLALALQIGLQ